MTAEVGDQIAALAPEIFRGVDLLGVFLNGVLGGTIARRRNFDPVGFAILAIISALGGGMLRDTLIQTGPAVALTDPYYLGTALAGALVAFLIHLDGRWWWNRFFIVGDAIVLGAWAATGALKALDADLGVLAAVLTGVTTAVGGGMIRDVVVGQVPAVFGGNTLYATPAILSALVTTAFHAQGRPTLGMLVAIVVGAGLSILARWRNWQLPNVEAVRLPAPSFRRRRGPEVHSLRPRAGARRGRRRLPGERGHGGERV